MAGAGLTRTINVNLPGNNPRSPVCFHSQGTLYQRGDKPYAYDLRVHSLGHGHIEAVALPRYAWHEVSAMEKLAQDDYAMALKEAPEPTYAELLQRAAENKHRAVRRAQTKVRRLCKWKGLDTLLTLTYRENMTDRDRMARDWDVFCKRVRRVMPGFEFVCVFERQKRGAWHAHIAVRKIAPYYIRRGVMVKSYDLLRSMWRAVVGADNGNVDVSRNKRVSRSSAKLAVYLSKYIGKELGSGLEKWENSYSASGRTLPDAISERVITQSQSEAISALMALIDPEISGQCEFHQALLDGGGYFLCLHPPDQRC